jgi:hypothetical protein
VGNCCGSKALCWTGAGAPLLHSWAAIPVEVQQSTVGGSVCSVTPGGASIPPGPHHLAVAPLPEAPPGLTGLTWPGHVPGPVPLGFAHTTQPPDRITSMKRSLE